MQMILYIENLILFHDYDLKSVTLAFLKPAY